MKARIPPVRTLPVRILLASLIAAFSASQAAAEIRLGLENQFLNPLLPSFYEPSTKRFTGLTVSLPVLPRLELQAGLARNHPYIDGPYNDVSNTLSTTNVLKLGAELEAWRTGAVRFFLGAGLERLRSEWHADDHSYEDPHEPQEFWSGGFTRWAVHAAPGVELFREKQVVDWTLSLAFPFYIAFATEMDGAGRDLDQRFREEYLNDTGMGVTLTLGLGLGR